MKTRTIGSMAKFNGFEVRIVSDRTRGFLPATADGRTPHEFYFYLVELPDGHVAKVDEMMASSSCLAIHEGMLEDAS